VRCRQKKIALTTKDKDLHTNYHDRPEVSATMLKSMAQGWRTFEAEHIAKTAPRKESAAMSLGTAIHTALLEPHKLSDYVVCPEECSDRRTKAYKGWAAENKGKTILTRSDSEIMAAIARRCSESSLISATLAMAGQREPEIYWKDKHVGTECRAKIDLLGKGVVVDVKTTQDARPRVFAKTIGDFRYDLQAAHYLDGTQCEAFIFLACETTYPFRVRLYELYEQDLYEAANRRHDLLEAYETRKAAGDWSEYGENEVCKILIPNYLKG
jgi:hypothetical protein